MNFDAPDMVSLLTLLIWTFMHTPKWINVLFHQILPSIDVVRELVVALDICVVHGFFEVIQAATPPSLSWFKSLPYAAIHAWGIYVIVLEKEGFFAKIYIGSATNMARGLGTRIRQYVRWFTVDRTSDEEIPTYVKEAVADGYAITHYGCLVKCSMPKPEDVLRLRVVTVAIEAVLTAIFWAIRSEKKDNGIGMTLPWTRDMVEWQGVCSHSPFVEPIWGDFSLTPDQLIAMAEQREQKNKEYQQDYGKQMRANADDEYRAKQAAANAKRAPTQKQIYKDVKASKTF